MTAARHNPATTAKRSSHRRWIKPTLLVTLLVLVGIAHRDGWIDLASIHEWLTRYAHHWWAMLALVLLKTVMYAFALPASTLILLAGSLYAPWWATTLTVGGGLLGGLAAYALVHYLSADMVARHADGRRTAWLRQHAGFLEFCAFRSLPGFPHSMLNYSAGVLRVKLRIFIPSTVIGLAIKGYVYTAAVHAQVAAGQNGDRLHWDTLWPLAAWAALLLLGALAKRRWR